MSITATATTFTKLRNGSWGVKGTGLAAGRIVGVAKRDGSHSNVTIDKVIWTDGKVQIASIKSDRAATAARYSRPPVTPASAAAPPTPATPATCPASAAMPAARATTAL